ncbi:TraG family conjugative transposon ATPase [Tamlana sp. 2_MG-2023]|uniref:TraG family conjugative transposon ATPase n=1 Tax=unclassified Tamlana TaxID=2614803 RepID=UPI0026E3F87A|nr:MULTISPECIES: TraG family conjugative transposon ATPase [unclassified Tamlana]MDO6761866.1 TraG family conjugative transposon ATPase [Tamlana sp. 2_MG-2023]MDO6792637.1 TraG family conjugative transposon ATPase [Tamlana sp. 1_MG-2023]
MNRLNLLAYEPILDIQEHMVFASNGNVILCFQCQLPEIYALSASDFDAVHGVWFQAFKSLPVGTVIHKQDIYIKSKYNTKHLPQATFLGEATANHFNGRDYLEHQSFLFITMPHNKRMNISKYVNPFKSSTKDHSIQIDRKIDTFKSSVNDAVAFVNTSRKIQLIPLDGAKIRQLTQSYFNGFNEDCLTDIRLDKSSIGIGDFQFDAIAVNHESCFGEFVQSSKTNDRFTSDDFVFHQGFIDGLGLNLNKNHIVNQIIYLDDKQQWRKLLDNKIEALKKSANFGTQNKVVLKKIEEVVAQINEDESSRLIRGHLNVVFWDTDQDKLKTTASKIKAECKALDILPYYPRGEERKHYVLNSFFCHSSNFSNEDLYVTDLKHALCLFINNTNYISDDTGVLFNDRQFNIPILKDVWDEDKKRIKARNFAIFAPTGEGKSFLANNILRQYFESEVRLVIIDLGGSYSKFAKLYPKDHIILRYEQGKNLGINPFYIENIEDVTPERLEDLSIFLLELLASGNDTSKAEEVAIKKILRHYYQQAQNTVFSLSGLYQFVDLKKDTLLVDLGIQERYFNVYDFLHVLSEYVDDGLYNFLFNTDEDQTYKIEDKRLIVFELDEVRDNKEILSVMLKLIKSAIQRTIWRNKAERGVILFDEFAKQLKFKNVLESVEFYYQAIRKQNGAIGIVLQSINQLPNNATSASILENTQIVYSLHNEKGYDELQKRLSLSSHDLNQLKSIRNNLTGERKYTEMFIKIGKTSNVFRLEVPKEVFAAYLTDGKAHEHIMSIYSEVKDMEMAIKQYVKEL